MTMNQFYKRFSSTMKAPTSFLKSLRKIQDGLDCRFNYLEKRWMVIKWAGAPLLSEWSWVMTVQDQETKYFMEPCDYVLRRIQYLKKVFDTDEILKEIEAEEKAEQDGFDRDLHDITWELAKDTRKVLINDYQGLVSTWNNFI